MLLGLTGGLFVLTQYMQFSLGYSPLQTGLRITPVAAVILVAAPASTLITRHIGAKAIVSLGLGIIATGFFVLSRTTVHGTYGAVLPAFLLLGCGAGLCMPTCTDAVMGSVPPTRAGIAAATNGASLQTGGALGVGILGSLLSGRYQSHIGHALHGTAVPQAVLEVIRGSLGGALEVANRLGGASGRLLASAARLAFISGMDLAVLVAGTMAAAAAVTALMTLPSRAAPAPGASPDQAGDGEFRYERAPAR